MATLPFAETKKAENVCLRIKPKTKRKYENEYVVSHSHKVLFGGNYQTSLFLLRFQFLIE